MQSRKSTWLWTMAVGTSLSLAAPALADPVTQACLGLGDDVESIKKALASKCPAGTSLSDSRSLGTKAKDDDEGDGAELSCKVAKGKGTIPVRQGPAVWFHKSGKVERAGLYDAHTKVGRWYRFDEQGRLKEIEDLRDDWSTYGFSVECDPESGQLLGLNYYDKNGQRQGKSFRWKEDGSFSYGFVNENDKTKDPLPRDAKYVQPDWCQIKTCDVFAKPNTPIQGSEDPTGGIEIDKKVKLTSPPKKSRIGQ